MSGKILAKSGKYLRKQLLSTQWTWNRKQHQKFGTKAHFLGMPPNYCEIILYTALYQPQAPH